MSGDKNSQRLVVGGVPRADLLPPEIKQDKVAGRQRSNLIAGLVLVVFLVVVAYGISTFLAIGANASLEAAQKRSSELLAEQAEYSEVRELQAQLSAAESSLLVASSPEVDWSPFLTDFYATLPAGSIIQTVTVTPPGTLASTSPLYKAEVIEIVAEIRMVSVPDNAAWMGRLKTLPGFADWSPTVVTSEDGGFDVTVTIHLGEDALWGRYFPNDETDSNSDSGDAEETEEEETAP